MVTSVESRADRIRVAIGYLVDRDTLRDGDLTRLADHFGVSRERVRQLKKEVLRSRVGIRPTVRVFGVDRHAKS